jgi:hypothetical protein
MNQAPHGIAVQIVRFLDDRFPGWVACEFVDANSLRHVLIDKYPVFTDALLDASSTYPQTGSAPCEVLDRWQDSRGHDLVRVTIARPWGMESTEGLSEFVLTAAQLSN